MSACYPYIPLHWWATVLYTLATTAMYLPSRHKQECMTVFFIANIELFAYIPTYLQVAQCNSVIGIGAFWPFCFGYNGRSNACYIA